MADVSRYFEGIFILQVFNMEFSRNYGTYRAFSSTQSAEEPDFARYISDLSMQAAE